MKPKMFELCANHFIPADIELIRVDLTPESESQFLLLDYKTPDGKEHRACVFASLGDDPVDSFNRVKSFFLKDSANAASISTPAEQTLEIPSFIRDAARAISKGKQIRVNVQ